MFRNCLTGAALVMLALPAAGFAGVIIGATSVSSPQGSLGPAFGLVNIINQSYLSAAYTSGVTDFATFTATTTADGIDGTGFTNTENSGPQTFTFDLGSIQSIAGIAVWNTASVGRITAFELLADTDADATNGGTTALLPVTALGDGGGLAYLFSFGATNTQFIHFVGTSSLDSPDYYGLAEVAFDKAADSAVPEPSTAMLLSLAAALLLVMRAIRS